MKTTQDTYGSSMRDAMKRSMEEPYRPLNKREPQDVHAGWLIVVFVAVLSLGFFGTLAFDRWEAGHRTHAVSR